MKIQFVNNCTVNIEEENDNGRLVYHTQKFEVGDEEEGTITEDYGNFVDFEFMDGSMIGGLQKRLFKIVEP